MRLVVVLALAAAAMAEELPDFDKLWNYDDPSATEAKFKELLPKAVASGSADYRLQLQTQIARTLGLQGRFDEAHAVLDGVEKELTPVLTTARVRYLLERGRALNSAKQPDKAEPLFVEAWVLGSREGIEFHAIDAAHMLGIVKTGEEALAWSEKAMALDENGIVSRARGWLPTLYNNIGWTYHDMGQYEKALAVLRKCWNIHQERAPDSDGARIAKWSVAKQLRMLRRVDEALAMQRELDAEYGKLGRSDGFVREEIGECLVALGKDEEAVGYFGSAYRLLKDIDWVAEDGDRIARLKTLGHVKE